MPWRRQPDIRRIIDRFVIRVYLCYLWIFSGLKRIEKIELRTPLKPDCGIDATVWQRNNNWYFFLVTDFHGGFPDDWKAPESSKIISPAMYLDVLQRYLALNAYVERLNTGESQPGTLTFLEDLTISPESDTNDGGEDDNDDHSAARTQPR